MKRPLPKISRAAVVQVYRTAYGEPLPKGWRVEWRRMGSRRLACCYYGSRAICFNTMYIKRWDNPPYSILETLIHEFTHMRCGKRFKHGPEFNALVRAACGRVGVPVLRHGHRSLHTGKAYRTRKEAA